MKRSILAAATVAALSAGTVLVSGPAALAAPGHGHGPSTHGHAPAPHGTHQLQNAQRKVQHEVRRKDAQLERVLDFQGLTVLATGEADAVRASIEADRVALAALGEQVPATTTLDEVRAIAVQVRAVRPNSYRVTVNKLRNADDVAAATTAAETLIAGLTAQADALEATGVDVTTVRTALDAATLALQDAVTAATTAADLAGALSATSSRDDLQAVVDAVAAAAEAAAVVADQIQAAVDALAALTTPTAPVTP